MLVTLSVLIGYFISPYMLLYQSLSVTLSALIGYFISPYRLLYQSLKVTLMKQPPEIAEKVTLTKKQIETQASS